jgi:hypothetical protein
MPRAAGDSAFLQDSARSEWYMALSVPGIHGSLIELQASELDAYASPGNEKTGSGFNLEPVLSC